jgi:hypothetical protein
VQSLQLNAGHKHKASTSPENPALPGVSHPIAEDVKQTLSPEPKSVANLQGLDVHFLATHSSFPRSILIFLHYNTGTVRSLSWYTHATGAARQVLF